MKKIKLTCSVCAGILYQSWDNKNREWYIETMKCLSCGRQFKKETIKEQLHEH